MEVEQFQAAKEHRLFPTAPATSPCSSSRKQITRRLNLFSFVTSNFSELQAILPRIVSFWTPQPSMTPVCVIPYSINFKSPDSWEPLFTSGERRTPLAA